MIQHTIKGSKFEIYSPMIKEEDGSWVTNRFYIYIGNFSSPVPGKSGGGFDASILPKLNIRLAAIS